MFLLSFNNCRFSVSDFYSYMDLVPATNMNSWYLTRRVMLIDTLSGREKSLSLTPRVIRVASNIKIR